MSPKQNDAFLRDLMNHIENTTAETQKLAEKFYKNTLEQLTKILEAQLAAKKGADVKLQNKTSDAKPQVKPKGPK